MKEENEYYQSFSYIILKKFTVQDRKEVKNYAKKGIFFYIIQENINKNRFLFISTQHYEEKTCINSVQFELTKIKNPEEFYFKLLKNKFKQTYFKLSKEKTSYQINLRNICFNKKKTQNVGENGEEFFSKSKVHTKKIALDNPNWYKDYLTKNKIKSYLKKFEKEIYCKNEYDENIKENFISTLFSLKDNKFQIINDHSIFLDEGKTGKSSLISYLSNKCDNISVAGLYGSSNSKEGKFSGGLVTLTKKTIIIDETNELAENTKNDKILSILNTYLENGTYNYIKQFSAEIKGCNQFIFLGNITEEFDFAMLLNNLIGNNYTFGRRIGVIVYNSNLKGFKKGLIRTNPSKYVLSIQIYLTDIFNYILYDTKFYSKTIYHKKYVELESFYKKELLKLLSITENETLRHFINSHKESIARQVTRALKLYIYKHLDQYLNESKPLYKHEIVFEVLSLSKSILENNIFHIKNIVTDINEIDHEKNRCQRNLKKYDELPKYYRDMIKFFFNNKDLIIKTGTNYNQLENKKDIKDNISKFKTGKRNPQNLISFIKQYGCLIKFKTNNELICYFTNKDIFLKKCDGLFEKINIDVSKTSKNP